MFAPRLALFTPSEAGTDLHSFPDRSPGPSADALSFARRPAPDSRSVPHHIVCRQRLLHNRFPAVPSIQQGDLSSWLRCIQLPDCIPPRPDLSIVCVSGICQMPVLSVFPIRCNLRPAYRENTSEPQLLIIFTPWGCLSNQRRPSSASALSQRAITSNPPQWTHTAFPQSSFRLIASLTFRYLCV